MPRYFLKEVRFSAKIKNKNKKFHLFVELVEINPMMYNIKHLT